MGLLFDIGNHFCTYVPPCCDGCGALCSIKSMNLIALLMVLSVRVITKFKVIWLLLCEVQL